MRFSASSTLLLWQWFHWTCSYVDLHLFMLVGAWYLYFITTIEIKVYWMNTWVNIIKADDHQIECYVYLVAQSGLTLCNPIDCSPPGSSVHGIPQTRILEWVAIPFSRGSSWPRNQIQVSYIAGRSFTIWATRQVPLKLVKTNRIYEIINNEIRKYFSRLEYGTILITSPPYRLFYNLIQP